MFVFAGIHLKDKGMLGYGVAAAVFSFISSVSCVGFMVGLNLTIKSMRANREASANASEV